MIYSKELIHDIIGWDINNWFQAIPFWESNTGQDLSKCYALEIGAENGGLSLWLALQGCRVICSNIGGVPHETRVIHKKYNVSSLIEYQDINALSIQYADTFDLIAFKSVLGGIGRHNKYELQKQSIQQMYKALKPGGELFFEENLVSTKLHMFFRKYCSAAGKDHWRYITLAELSDMMLLFSQCTYKTTGFISAFFINERMRNILSKIDQLICSHINKEAWNYIVFGIAKK